MTARSGATVPMLLLLLVVSCALPKLALAQPIGPDAAVRDALAWSPEYRQAADWISTGLVGAAVVLPCTIDRHWKCVGREALAVGAAYLTAEILKRLVHRERPNGADAKSFLSMHTSIACAAVLSAKHKRELWSLCPSVAYTRIAADWHYFTDVAAGAGQAAAWSGLVVIVLRW